MIEQGIWTIMLNHILNIQTCMFLQFESRPTKPNYFLTTFLLSLHISRSIRAKVIKQGNFIQTIFLSQHKIRLWLKFNDNRTYFSVDINFNIVYYDI